MKCEQLVEPQRLLGGGYDSRTRVSDADKRYEQPVETIEEGPKSSDPQVKFSLKVWGRQIRTLSTAGGGRCARPALGGARAQAECSGISETQDRHASFERDGPIHLRAPMFAFAKSNGDFD